MSACADGSGGEGSSSRSAKNDEEEKQADTSDDGRTSSTVWIGLETYIVEEEGGGGELTGVQCGEERVDKCSGDRRENSHTGTWMTRVGKKSAVQFGLLIWDLDGQAEEQ